MSPTLCLLRLARRRGYFLKLEPPAEPPPAPLVVVRGTDTGAGLAGLGAGAGDVVTGLATDAGG